MEGVDDANGLREYSVVYTDRALNHMSQKFQGVMRGISRILKSAYNADTVAVIPGSGSYAMEAVARQFATGQKCMVIRNGYFSYRWSDIFKVCRIPSSEIVLKVRPSVRPFGGELFCCWLRLPLCECASSPPQ